MPITSTPQAGGFAHNFGLSTKCFLLFSKAGKCGDDCCIRANPQRIFNGIGQGARSHLTQLGAAAVYTQVIFGAIGHRIEKVQ